MAPLEHDQQQFAALQLPPLSPRQGIIRLAHPDGDEKAGRGRLKGHQSGKADGRHDQKHRPTHSHAQRSDHASVGRNESERGRAKNEDRGGQAKRDHSLGRSGRDGGVSVISRIEAPSAEQSEERGGSRSHHHHQPHHHHQLNWHQGQSSTRGSTFHPIGTRSSNAVNASREMDFNSRLDVDSQSSSTRPGVSSGAGKLFDPRKDDPVRFATLKTKYGMIPGPGSSKATFTPSSVGSFSVASSSDVRSLASNDHSTNISSEGREKRRRRGPSSRTTNDSGEKKKGGGEGDNNSYVVELKRWYREISTLEHKLQEEHRSASERQRKDQAEPSAAPHLASRLNASHPGHLASGELDHPYWINLISQHRQLAETHAAFLEAALKPGLPASLHSLPQSYNIPTRLWHTAFHSLLERLRHTLPCPTSQASDLLSEDESATFKRHQGEVLDLLTEYIYYAYSFYSNLLESETFKTFRSSWIENLGDLARYRMAVAKVMAKQEPLNEKEKKEKMPQSESASSHGASLAPDDTSHDRASIGSGALQDWDLEEKEVWRLTAKDWYAKGLSEMPGIGRLHHHLGILSRDDELRALHHFCKSLTSSHPYLSTRESILPLFDRESQTRRVQPDATLIELFVHLHGILFTKVQMDDFEDVFMRFKERLQVARATVEDADDGLADTVTLSSWMMMATVNIASLLQYGAGGGEGSSNVKGQGAEGMEVAGAKTTAGPDDEENEGEGEEVDEGVGAGAGQQGGTVEAEGPVAVCHAARLTFHILSLLISTSTGGKDSRRVNPYVTMILTFLSQECKQPALLQVMEEHVPWQKLLELGNSMPTGVEPIDPRREVPLRIRGDNSPLSEDWCLRGMAWVGRRVYERGFWKSGKGGGGGGANGQSFESEIEVLNQCAACYCGQESTGSGESGGEDGRSASTPMTLSMLRWKRVAYTLTVLIKTIPGLDFQEDSGGGAGGLLVLTSPLKEKLKAWETAAEEERQRIRLDKLAIATAEPLTDDEEASDGDDGDDGDDDEEPLDEEIRTLKDRRRQLRKQLQASKSLFGPPAAKAMAAKTDWEQNKGQQEPKRQAHILPGYTILLLDTNVLLMSANVLERLIESEKWTCVVPLAAITELEGLKKRPGSIGQRAEQAIDYVSNNLKSKTKHLKVQTSRGNYLTDLRFRIEDIDFLSVGGGGSPGVAGEEETDDQHHRTARSIDEIILRCLEWQRDHFANRLAILAKDEAVLASKQSQIAKHTVKAALLTLDRNLRLKARFRGLAAVGLDDVVDL